MANETSWAVADIEETLPMTDDGTNARIATVMAFFVFRYCDRQLPRMLQSALAKLYDSLNSMTDRALNIYHAGERTMRYSCARYRVRNSHAKIEEVASIRTERHYAANASRTTDCAI